MGKLSKFTGPDNRVDSYRIFMRFSTFLGYLASAFEDHWIETFLSRRGDVLHENIPLPKSKRDWIKVLKMDARKFDVLAEWCLVQPRTGCSTGIHNRKLQEYLAPNISARGCLAGGGLRQIVPYLRDERVQFMMLRKWLIEYNGHLLSVNGKQKQAFFSMPCSQIEQLWSHRKAQHLCVKADSTPKSVLPQWSQDEICAQAAEEINTNWRNRLESGEKKHGLFSTDERLKCCKFFKVMREKEEEMINRERAYQQNMHDARALLESCNAKNPMFQFVLMKASGTSELQFIHAVFKVDALPCPASGWDHPDRAERNYVPSDLRYRDLRVSKREHKRVVRAAVKAFRDLYSLAGSCARE
ncbi:hypothetical protein HII31_06058 [Pseudocercospora fuligena]|uniref:Uncharacterized protein n=1 Tax=Pseudocercospora fuligena TaxID=685502 RepID=A0A8H6RKA5_9PEZI|nr:hypothetical protein HII31_06058 [Pseudocercospora fuligena]